MILNRWQRPTFSLRTPFLLFLFFLLFGLLLLFTLFGLFLTWLNFTFFFTHRNWAFRRFILLIRFDGLKEFTENFVWCFRRIFHFVYKDFADEVAWVSFKTLRPDSVIFPGKFCFDFRFFGIFCENLTSFVVCTENTRLNVKSYDSKTPKVLKKCLKKTLKGPKMVQNEENINKVLGTMPDDIEKGGKNKEFRLKTCMSQ